jgi:hypothetical protein
MEDDLEGRRGGAHGLVRCAGLGSRHWCSVVTGATRSGRDETVIPPFRIYVDDGKIYNFLRIFSVRFVYKI